MAYIIDTPATFRGSGVVNVPSLTASSVLKTDASSNLTTGTVSLTTQVSGILPAANGGSGTSTIPTNGQLQIGNGTGYTVASVASGTGISTTVGAGSLQINNTGVLSITGTGSQISASSSTGNVTLSTPATFVAPGTIQDTTGMYLSTTTPISAAGSTQGTATGLTKSYNIVTTVASNTGVRLPTPSTGGLIIVVVNRGANTLNVYPQSGGTIDGAASNAAVTLVTNSVGTYEASTITQWYTISKPVVGGSGITITEGNGNTAIAAINSGTITSISAGTPGAQTGTSGLTFSVNPITSTGNIALATPVAATIGGTGQTTYTTGDLLYASSSSALSKLADVATGNALISGGVGVAPSWGKIGLTTHVSGTLPIANGGTGQSSALSNGKVIVSSSGAMIEASEVFSGGTNIVIGPTQVVNAFTRLIVRGTNATDDQALAPNMSFYTAADAHTLVYVRAHSHGNSSINFDSYILGGVWTSSSSTANFMINQSTTNGLLFQAATGFTAGTTITWNESAALRPNGTLQITRQASPTSTTYSVGTASQSTTTITGSGTTWTDAMVGGLIVWSTGSYATIIDRASNTSLTADISQTVSSGTYTIYFGAYHLARDKIVAKNLVVQQGNIQFITTNSKLAQIGVDNTTTDGIVYTIPAETELGGDTYFTLDVSLTGNATSTGALSKRFDYRVHRRNGLVSCRIWFNDTTGNTSANPITLTGFIPTGFRPPTFKHFKVAGNSNAQFNMHHTFIDSNGDVRIGKSEYNTGTTDHFEDVFVNGESFSWFDSVFQWFL